MVKDTVFPSRSTKGFVQCWLPFLVEIWKVLINGIATPQAGLGQGMVLAHSQAITEASLPSGSLAVG